MIVSKELERSEIGMETKTVIDIKNVKKKFNSRTIYFIIIKVVLGKSIDSRKFIVNKNNLAAKS